MGTTGGESWLRKILDVCCLSEIKCTVTLVSSWCLGCLSRSFWQCPGPLVVPYCHMRLCHMSTTPSHWTHITERTVWYFSWFDYVFLIIMFKAICHWNCFAITAMRVENLDHRISKTALGGNDHVPSIMKQQINSVDGTERDWGMTNGQWLSVCSGSRAVGHPLVSWW